MSKSKKEKKVTLGKGLDIGTMNIISAFKEGSNIQHKRIRDCFLDLETDAKSMLRLKKVDFIERDEEILLLGDPALKIANVFGRETKRPLSKGLVSPSEIDSIEVLSLMIKSVLGKPQEEDEICCFSVPAPPIDNPGQDIIYHKGVFTQIVSELGYDAIASNEAMAIIFSETAKEDFSGISISFGSGMSNVALSVNTIEAMSFSVQRGGDWIDSGAARSIGYSQSKICSIKESGNFDLLNPQNREEQAIAFYYRELITYVLKQISKKFKEVRNTITLEEPIPLVVSGGTSLAGSFMDFFKKVFEKKRKRFPIPISEVRHAKNPLYSVSNGLLIQAIQEHEDY